MIRKSEGEIHWLEFELLADIPNLVHGSFLRHGGVSSGSFASLNVGGGSGDDPKLIQKNRQRMLNALRLSHHISSRQCHGKNVVFIPHSTISEVEDCDGLVTQSKGIALMIKHADCQAAILYDPIEKVIANVHAGWRGNVQNIYAEAIALMRKKCFSKPENLLVCISPSLGPEHSEFKNYRTELPESFWEFQIKPTYFDLWAISRKQLITCGVLPHHIEIASLCTYAHSADFFSFRRGDRVTGTHATIVSFV